MSQTRELKDILLSIKEAKKKRSDIKKAVKSELGQSSLYQETLHQLDELKRQKAKIERQVKQSDMEKAEQLSLFIKDETQLLSDVALNKFMKGETIEVRDDNDAVYEPRFTVKFKRQ